MSVDYDKDKLLSNVKRQSKRLAQLLDVPLSKAQYFLSAYVYSEQSFAILRSKIESGHLFANLHFAMLGADAEQHVFDSFSNAYAELYVTLEESPLRELYSGSIKELIFNLFGLGPKSIPVRQ